MPRPKKITKKKLNWNNFKKSGSYCRKLQEFRDKIRKDSATLLNKTQLTSNAVDFQRTPTRHPSPECYGIPAIRHDAILNDDYNLTSSSDEDGVNIQISSSESELSDHVPDEFSPDEHENSAKNISFENYDAMDDTTAMAVFLKKWSIDNNIRQKALKPLLKQLNNRFNLSLPCDPRTLMGTPRNPSTTIINIVGGEYWHQGLEPCLRSCFANLHRPISIALNFNVDGLPLFNSSRDQFWPILFNVHGMNNIPAMTIGLFYGQSKPHRVEEFLEPFVSELIRIVDTGLLINGFLLSVTIRAFICDTPARAMIKG